MITGERLGQIQIALVGASIKQNIQKGPQPMGITARELAEIVDELVQYRRWRDVMNNPGSAIEDTIASMPPRFDEEAF